MLLKMLLKMCGIPEESAKHFICHTLAMNATNFFVVVLTIRYVAFSFILPNEFSIFYHFLSRRVLGETEGIHVAQLS